MRRINFFIKDSQYLYLKSLSGTISEHVRRALDGYIQHIRGLNASASTSRPEKEVD